MANYVTEGDITRTVIPVDAIVTLINSGGMWFGGVDGAIQRVAGGHYHAQAVTTRAANGLANGQVVVAHGSRTIHRGNFNDVIFVVDDLESPLNDLVYKALKAAKEQNYASIALPLMRTGVMLGAVEPNVQAVVREMRAAIDRFFAEGNVEMDIYIVVYREPEAVLLLSDHMKFLGS